MNEILIFFEIIEKIKHKERKGWIDIGVEGTKDTIASHSFGASLIGWVLSKKTKFDSDKVVKMLLIHDLIMSELSDFTPDDATYKTKREQENNLSENLLNNIPKSILPEFKELFKEYQEEKTQMSLFARECDKLDTLFQAYMYSKKLGRDELSQFLDSYEHKFKSKIGKELFLDLRNESKKLNKK